MKTYFIIFTVAVILITLACIFLWEWDGIYYIIWGLWAVVAISARITRQRLDK